jgi:hypothetical protein
MEGPTSKTRQMNCLDGEPQGEHQDPEQAQWQTM